MADWSTGGDWSTNGDWAGVTAGGTPGSVTPAAIALSAVLNAVTRSGGAVVQVGQQLALVLPQATPQGLGLVTPGAVSRSFSVPVVSLEGGTVVETGQTATITLPTPSLGGGSVVEVDSTDMAVVASQVTVIIAAVQYDQWVWVDNIW